VSVFGWREFLVNLNQELIGIDGVREEVGLPGEYDLPEDVEIAEWLGFEGASEAKIKSLEQRLGIDLPPSYRSFLVNSDGWRILGRGGVRLLPTTKVNWLKQIDPKLIEIWKGFEDDMEPIPDEKYLADYPRYDVYFRAEHIPDMLVISDRGTYNVHYLWLNPQIIFPDGEWEAWSFTTDDGYAARYRSFRDLMEHLLRRAKVDRKHG
jgi:hypothetical protein